MNLVIDSTFETPEVRFVIGEEFFIKGRVVPNISNHFWKDVNGWVSENSASIDDSIILNIEIDYINAYSMSQLVNMINGLCAIKARGLNLIVKWYADETENEDIYLIGQDLASTSNCQFEICNFENHSN